MKKIVNIMLVAVLLIVTVCGLSACSDVKGTYSAYSMTISDPDEDISETITFSKLDNASEKAKEKWGYMQSATLEITADRFIQRYSLDGTSYETQHPYKTVGLFLYLLDDNGNILPNSNEIPAMVTSKNTVVCTFTDGSSARIIVYKK